MILPWVRAWECMDILAGTFHRQLTSRTEMVAQDFGSSSPSNPTIAAAGHTIGTQ